MYAMLLTFYYYCIQRIAQHSSFQKMFPHILPFYLAHKRVHANVLCSKVQPAHILVPLMITRNMLRHSANFLSEAFTLPRVEEINVWDPWESKPSLCLHTRLPHTHTHTHTCQYLISALTVHVFRIQWPPRSCIQISRGKRNTHCKEISLPVHEAVQTIRFFN